MAGIPKKWQKSAQSLRAVQLVFEFNKNISELIRREASEQGMSPSDFIREIIGLPVKKPQRPRLTVSLSTQDYEILAQKYALTPDDKNAIRNAIKNELIGYSTLPVRDAQPAEFNPTA